MAKFMKYARTDRAAAAHAVPVDRFRVNGNRARQADPDTPLVFVRPRKLAGKRYQRGDAAPADLSAALRDRLVDQRILVPAEELA